MRIAVQREVLARLPRSKWLSVHLTWNELSEARTTLVTCTETVLSPTSANGFAARAYSPRKTEPRSVTKS